MEARDLRIGNLVNYSVDNRVIEIIGIEENALHGALITAKNEIGKFWLSGLKPIELTEEWLLKMGFDNRGWYYLKEENEIQVVINHKYVEGKFFLNETSGQDRMSVFIEYVHQLQNLYYSLTGQELKFLPPKPQEG